MGELREYVFKDVDDNEYVFIGRSKSEADRQRKRSLFDKKCDLVETRPVKRTSRVNVPLATYPSTSGPPRVRRQPPKVSVSPNGPCTCGSGRKYKHCCMRKKK